MFKKDLFRDLEITLESGTPRCKIRDFSSKNRKKDDACETGRRGIHGIGKPLSAS